MPLHLISHYVGPHGGSWEVHWFPRNSIAEDYAKAEIRKAKSTSTPIRMRPAASVRGNAKTGSISTGKIKAKAPSNAKAQVHSKGIRNKAK